tara:strand:+ start:248 stop:433 length:186 start_codon:yes stop_codon:yes gene_type:complete
MDFGGGETRKSAENEVTEEVKINANPKIIIFFNFIFPVVGLFIFCQKTNCIKFKLGRELIS